MKRLLTLRLAVAAATVVSMAAQGSGPRRDGNWQVTMEMDIPGMPQKMPPMTLTQCLTKEDAEDPSKLAPQGRGGAPSNCKVSDYKTEGNKVTWSMRCEGESAMSGTGEFVYSGDTYTGTMKMSMARGGQPMTMTMKYSGKRLGDCVK
jgi:hypothetical protein